MSGVWRRATEAEVDAWLEFGTPPGEHYRLVPGGLLVEDVNDE